MINNGVISINKISLDKHKILSIITLKHKGLKMDKQQKIRQAANNARVQRKKSMLKKIILFPWELCKKIWRFICRICKAIWNWLKSIDIIGMINLTLLVAIIVLFMGLILNFRQCNQSANGINTASKPQIVDTRKVVQRKSVPNLQKKPQIQIIDKPVAIKNISLPANKKLPKQVLMGDVIIDTYANSPVLLNGAVVKGNLFIQNMRKYTLPCDIKINGNLFIRNVDKLNFCGKFTVRGNIYVSKESSFGVIPSAALVTGQVIL